MAEQERATRPDLSVVVPAYNEVESLPGTIEAVRQSVPVDTTVEIVVVNDGSTDGTADLLRELAESGATDIVLVDRPTNGGMGQALADGCQAASGTLLTWIPGDGEYDLGEVLGGLPQLKTADIVLARRRSRGQLGRNLLSSAMYVLIRTLFRFDARGYCGIFLLETDAFRRLGVGSRDVFFTLEVAIRSRHQGARIGYIEVEWRPRRAGRSKVFNVRTVLRNVAELFAFRITLWRGR